MPVVSNIMTPNPMTVTPRNAIRTAVNLMREGGFRRLPVVDRGRLVGIITEYDIMNTAVSGEADRTRVGEAMHREVFTFTPDTDLETIVNTCLVRRIHRAPITQEGKLVGIVSRRDIMREILAMYHRP